MYSSIISLKNTASTHSSKKSLPQFNIEELRKFWEASYTTLHSQSDDSSISAQENIKKLEGFEIQFEAEWPAEYGDTPANYLEALCYMQMIRIQIMDKFLNAENIENFNHILEKTNAFYRKFKIEFTNSAGKLDTIVIKNKHNIFSSYKNISLPENIKETESSFLEKTSLVFSKASDNYLTNSEVDQAKKFSEKAKDIFSLVYYLTKEKNNNIRGYLEAAYANAILNQGKFKDAYYHHKKSFSDYYGPNNWGILQYHDLIKINYFFYKNSNPEKIDEYVKKNIEKYLDFPVLPPFRKEYSQSTTYPSHTTAWPSGKIEINAPVLSIEESFSEANTIKLITSTHHLVFRLQHTEKVSFQHKLFELAIDIRKNFFSSENITRSQIQEIVAFASIPDPSFYYELIFQTLRRIENKPKDDEYINLVQGLLSMLRARPSLLLAHPELKEDIFSEKIDFNYLPLRVKHAKMSIETLKEKLIEIAKTNVKLTSALSDIKKDSGTAKPLNEILANLWEEIEKLEAPEEAKKLLEGMHASAQLKALTEFVSLQSSDFKDFLSSLGSKLAQAVEENNIEKVKILLQIISDYLDIAVTLLPKQEPIADIETRKNFYEMRAYLFHFAQQDNLELKYQALYALEALQYILPEESTPILTDEQKRRIFFFTAQIALFAGAQAASNAARNDVPAKIQQAGWRSHGELMGNVGNNLMPFADFYSSFYSSNEKKVTAIKHTYHAWYPALWVVRSLLEKRDYIKLRAFIAGNNQREEPEFLWGLYRYLKQIVEMPEVKDFEEDRKIAISYLKKLALGGQSSIKKAAQNTLQALGISAPEYGPKIKQEDVNNDLLLLPPFFWRSESDSNDLLKLAKGEPASH